MIDTFFDHHKAVVSIILLFQCFFFLFLRKLFSDKSRVSEQLVEKTNGVCNLSHTWAFLPSQPDSWVLWGSVATTSVRHCAWLLAGLTAPAGLAAGSHPPQSPRAEPGSGSPGRGGCPHRSWKHPGPRARQGHLRPFNNLPRAPNFTIPALLEYLLPIFPASVLRGGLCTTACWAGIPLSKAVIERGCQTSGRAPMCATYSSSREQHFEWPPGQLCLLPADVGTAPHRHAGEQAAPAGEHRADKGGGSQTCCAGGAALPSGAATLWLRAHTSAAVPSLRRRWGGTWGPQRPLVPSGFALPGRADGSAGL